MFTGLIVVACVLAWLACAWGHVACIRSWWLRLLDWTAEDRWEAWLVGLALGPIALLVGLSLWLPGRQGRDERVLIRRRQP